ncbi:hypothetical protein [Azoarcus olearius]|uniref:Tryptophan synthase subunit beta like protein n=1 Tax=Azoarcus sp. (strain BH72) TaxID=418699 RepID=A1K363_AZOSB|nr:hypothetical protein [Azoarcus olearius]CAL93268.1 conserved hypothetical protein [Azoarcus olearius]
MPFVERDASGNITAVALEQSAAAREWLEPGDPAVAAFARRLGSHPGEALAALESSDIGLIRVIEDLIDTLLAKDVIRFTDLPLPAQNRLLQRRSLRQSLNSDSLLDDDAGLL